MKNSILIEGYSSDEILALPTKDVEVLVFSGQPFIFRVGTAEILGEFTRIGRDLRIELAKIEGGGEGVLPALWALVRRYAVQSEFERIEWIIHALNCAEPNPKLPPLLEKRGFKIEEVSGGSAYRRVDVLQR